MRGTIGLRAGLCLTACSVLALAVQAPAAFARSEIGVAAAVNPQAERTPPGAGTRTVVLGDRLIFKERIRTQGAGLVQILLLDGSTFTVGANSDLVIDEFVYDPEAGSGKLVASFGRGVARFVGGKLSKNPGGVTVNTPVGTIGIRGGIANLDVTPQEARFSLLFGEELSFLGPNGASRRIFERGYTLNVTQGNSGVPQTTIRPTTQTDLANVQGQLSGTPGQNGGTPTPPTNDRVDGSGFGQVNSGMPVTNVLPLPKPTVVAASNLEENERNLDDINRDLNDEIVRDDVTGPSRQIAVRVLSSGNSFTPSGAGFTVSAPGRQDLIGGSSETDQTRPSPSPSMEPERR